MKKFLKILIFILVLLLILAIVLMFVSPAQLKLQQTKTLEGPPNMAYNVVNDFSTWESWSPWAKMDPDAVNTYTEKTSGVGAVWKWKGDPKSVGEGSQKIVESKEGEKIRTELEFVGWDGLSYSDWIFEKAGDKTKATWTSEVAETPFYMRPINLFMKGGLKKTYAEGLTNLDGLLKKRVEEKVYRGYKINEIDLPEKHYVINRAEIKIENIQQFYTQNLGALFGKLQGSNIEMDGMPSGLFFKWNQTSETTDMAASIPVKEEVAIKGASSYTIPAGKALRIDFYGDYSKTANAHYALDDYMRDYGLLNNPPMVEEYVTDPTEEKDPEKWLTKITYYIAE